MKKRGRKRTNIATALANVETPVFAVDVRRRVVFFNHGCEKLSGWSAADVLARTCEYRSDGEPGDVEMLLNALCPPPEAFEGRRMRIPTYVPTRDGASLAREMTIQPLVDADGNVSMVLGFIDPVLEGESSTTRPSGIATYHAELASLRSGLRRRYGRDSMIGRSPKARRQFEQVDLATRGSNPVLFVGEPGTGRTHAARVLHVASGAPNRILVPVDCERVPALELKRVLKRLLGGGDSASPTGIHPGSLLLQNVEGLPRELQQMVVEFHSTPVGTRPGLRLLGTTSVDPESPSTRESFVPEFLFLLTTQRIELAPLRDRLDDLEPLAIAFLEETNRGAESQVGGFEAAVWDEFRRYHWPGNLAELRSIVAEARDACRNAVVRVDDLPFRLRAGIDSRKIGPVRRGRPRPLGPLLEEVETEQIRLALAEARGNKSRAAELLGITRARLYRRIEQLGLEDGSPSDDG